MSKKTDWATQDKRIRARRAYWSKEDVTALDSALAKLPDSADGAENIELPQPALSSSQSADGQAEA
jgi:hypothetical protein